jgi:hypothetical protein
MFTPNVIETPGSTPVIPPDSGVVRGGVTAPRVLVAPPAPNDTEFGHQGTTDADETGRW